MEESKAKDCLKKIDPIDSLYFDVSVARHMIEEGKYDEADVWLDPNHALLELRRSLKQDFITADEYSALEITIGDIRSTIKITGELLQAMKTITELQTFLAVRTYHSFLKCMQGSKFGSHPDSNPAVHGLWECVAGFGGLEDGISEQNVDVAIRNIKSIDRGTEIMVQDKLIPPPERLAILDKLNNISTLVEAKQWEETIKLVWGPSGLEGELHNLLEKICGDDSPSKMSSRNPGKAEPLIPYWAIPAAFTLILIGVSFAGWVATQLEGEA